MVHQWKMPLPLLVFHQFRYDFGIALNDWQGRYEALTDERTMTGSSSEGHPWAAVARLSSAWDRT